MPPDRSVGRASKACEACRKSKTRCYETPGGRACLRCERTRQQCSFEVENRVHRNGASSPTGSQARYDQRIRQAVGDDDRFSQLERTIDTLMRRMDDIEATRLRTTRKSPTQDAPQILHGIESQTTEQAPAPLFVLRDVTAETGFHAADITSTNTPLRGPPDDLVLKGLISEQDALTLVGLFNENYGRWVAFDPLLHTRDLFEELRHSPFLLIACCLIAIRHTSLEQATIVAPQLFKEAKTLLSSNLLNVPQSIEFFQAALILSMWSTTIGQIPLGIDSWLLSGFALQHSVASDVFRFSRTETGRPNLNKQQLDRLCIWNHLCLVHLHYCVGTRRKAMVDRSQVDTCRVILDSDISTNFESRMVAEVYLYWIIYENCSVSLVDLPQTQAALHAWNDEWGYLFDQPRSQFVKMGFYFAQLLAYDQSLKSRSAAVRESVLSEMVRLSTTIINLAMDTADERTRHLTDHIYHMISFAAITLCRLLHTYDNKLSASHDLDSLDILILSLVSWLHAIGLPCHVAHTMGDVVASVHKKLRPDSRPSPSASYADVDSTTHDDFAQLFPELFGAGSFNTINGSMLPDLNTMF